MLTPRLVSDEPCVNHCASFGLLALGKCLHDGVPGAVDFPYAAVHPMAQFGAGLNVVPLQPGIDVPGEPPNSPAPCRIVASTVTAPTIAAPTPAVSTPVATVSPIIVPVKASRICAGGKPLCAAWIRPPTWSTAPPIVMPESTYCCAACKTPPAPVICTPGCWLRLSNALANAF